jgi:hypothetical protein
LDPIPSIIPCTSLLEVYNKGFPAIKKKGDFPDLIVDPQAFYLLQDMLHGYIWRPTCDVVLAVDTVQACKFLATFLEQSETAIKVDSYFSTKLLSRFCPNFAYHFKMAQNWATRPNPLADLALLHTVSLQAQKYDPVIIDLHIERHPDMSLMTRDQVSKEAHHCSTPHFLIARTSSNINFPSLPQISGLPAASRVGIGVSIANQALIMAAPIAASAALGSS